MNCPTCGSKLLDWSHDDTPWYVCPSEECEWRHRDWTDKPIEDGEQG